MIHTKVISLLALVFSSFTLSFNDPYHAEQEVCSLLNEETVEFINNNYYEACSYRTCNDPRQMGRINPVQTNNSCNLIQNSNTHLTINYDYRFEQHADEYEKIDLILKSKIICILPVYDESKYQCYFEMLNQTAFTEKNSKISSEIIDFETLPYAYKALNEL